MADNCGESLAHYQEEQHGISSVSHPRTLWADLGKEMTALVWMFLAL